MHVPLNSIVKDTSMLSNDERKFAQNPWSHVDFLIFNKLDKEPVLAVEVDGHEFHRNNEKQLDRDKLKDKILEKINLPILRIATNESGEKEKLIEMLNKVVEMSIENT
jgi:very-short-patch-repair endonuclease